MSLLKGTLVIARNSRAFIEAQNPMLQANEPQGTGLSTLELRRYGPYTLLNEDVRKLMRGSIVEGHDPSDQQVTMRFMALRPIARVYRA